jgi:hypothetical protein
LIDDSSNDNIKPGKNRCFKCNAPIYFTPTDTETPSGRPTRDPLTGKVKPLDPSTTEYHICKLDDIEAFRGTEEYRQRVTEWKAKQQNNRNVEDTSTTKDTDATPTNNDVTCSRTEIFGRILADIDHIRTDLTAIKNALKIGTGISSGEAER